MLALLDLLREHFETDRDKILAAVERSAGTLPPEAKDKGALETLRAELVRTVSLAGTELNETEAKVSAIVRALPAGESKQILSALFTVQAERADSIAGVRSILAMMPVGDPLRRQLELFLDEGMTDVTLYRQRLSTWFDQGMDRLSGVYKRRAQLISVVFGILIAFAVGVDSWGVANALMRDGALRQATVAAAMEAVKTAPTPSASPAPLPAPSSAPEEKGSQPPNKTDASQLPKPSDAPDPHVAIARMANAINQIDALKLPIGWDYLDAGARAARKEKPSSPLFCSYWLLRILGMAFTGLAVALGAPFWFDMLSKLINLRSAGPAPTTTTKASDPATAGK